MNLHNDAIKDSKNKLKRNEKMVKDIENGLTMLNEFNDKKIKKIKEECADMPYLKTEEEAAEKIADFHKRKKESKKSGDEDDGYNENGLDINGLDRDSYNINDLNEYGLDRNGYNINSIKGTRIKYPNKRLNYKRVGNGNMYDRYGFDSNGCNINGYNIYGFDKNGLNKDGLNKYGYKNH